MVAQVFLLQLLVDLPALKGRCLNKRGHMRPCPTVSSQYTGFSPPIWFHQNNTRTIRSAYPRFAFELCRLKNQRKFGSNQVQSKFERLSLLALYLFFKASESNILD